MPDSPDTRDAKAVSGKKKLRIQKYPDTFGRGLDKFILFKMLTCSAREHCLQGFFQIPSLFYSNLINGAFRI